MPNLLSTKPGRRLLFAALYFSEGAPIGYIWWALPTKLRAAGLPLDQITTLTALIALPWMFKFLWAPLVDTWRGPRFGYRAWIMCAQLGMGVTLIPLLPLDITQSLDIARALLLAHAVCAATQDVAVDAFCINTIDDSEHGAINGWMQFGMLLGRSVFGGAILYLEKFVGESTTLPLMIACIWCSGLLVWFAPEPATSAHALNSQQPRRFLKTLRAVFAKRSTWLALLFAATGGAAFESVGSVARPLLIDFGLTEDAVGLFSALPAVIGMAAGALLGGYLADRFGHRATVRAVGMMLASVVAILALALLVQCLSPFTLQCTITLCYLLTGAFTAATYALFMDITDPALSGTQFSTFMGATNLCEIWVGLLTGYLASQFGYAMPFLLLSVVAAAALLMVPRQAVPDIAE